MNKKNILIIMVMMILLSSFSSAIIKLHYKFSDDFTDEINSYTGQANSVDFSTGYPTFNSTGSGTPKSASFNNVADWLNTTLLYSTGDAWSVSFWLNTTDSTNNHHMLSFSNDYCTNHQFYAYGSSVRGYLSTDYGNSQLTYWTFANTVYYNGGWNHIVFTSINQSANSQEVYINTVDQNVGNAIDDGISACNNYWGFGDGAFNNQGFVGLIDEVMIFNQVLNQSQINELYNYGNCTGCGFDGSAPIVSIDYPTNTTYTELLHDLNYTQSNGVNCWYSKDGGVTNSSHVSAGENFSGLTGVEGSNNWTVFCDNAYGNTSTSVGFSIELTHPTKIVKQFIADELVYYSNAYGGWQNQDNFNDSDFSTQSTPADGRCANITKTYYKSSANGTEVNSIIFESKMGVTSAENFTINNTLPNCFDQENITIRYWCPSDGHIQIECINITGEPTVLKNNFVGDQWAYETAFYWNVTINQSIQVDFYDLPPTNGTETKDAINLSFNLLAYNKTANCTIFANNFYLYEYVNITEGGYNIAFNDSYWIQGYNELNVTCENSTQAESEIKYIFVDDINPFINWTTPVNLSYYPREYNIPINLSTNDTNNYALNISVNFGGNSTFVYSNYSVNITETYNHYSTLNLLNNATGWYKYFVLAIDGHTKQKIKPINERNIISGVYIGKVFNDIIKVYFKKSDIFTFGTKNFIDRKSFDIKFKDKRSNISIYVEANNIKYVGDKYGYIGHFIIDDNYWIDFNNNASMYVTDYKKHNDSLYELFMYKNPNIDYVLFHSIGVLNKNNETRYSYYQNYNLTGVHTTVQTYYDNTWLYFNYVNGTDIPVYVKIYNLSEAKEVFFSVNPIDSLNNMDFKLGELTNSVYSYDSSYEGFLTTPNLNNQFNQVYANCSCTYCNQTTDGYCLFPIWFNSTSSGEIVFRDFYAGLILDAGELNITIIDGQTLLPLTGENITVEMVGTEYQTSGTTTTSNLTLSYFFNESRSLNLSIRAFQTNTPRDYSIVIRNVELVQGETSLLTMYLSNTSDSNIAKYITFRVVDESASRIEGATVKIYKQNPSTNELLLITELNTNPNGEASTILFTDDVFYKFVVVYDGLTIFSSVDVVPISVNDDTIVLSGYFGEDYFKYADRFSVSTLADYSLNFHYLSNTSGYYYASSTSDGSIESCIYVWMVNSTGYNFLSAECQNGTNIYIVSQNISSALFKTYIGQLQVDTGDGEGKLAIKNLVRRIGNTSIPEEKSATIIVLFVAIILAGFGFYFSPQIGLIFFIAELILIRMTKLVLIQDSVIFVMISLSIISLITITRTKLQ